MRIRSKILGRKEDEDERYEVRVNGLNIRSGPGVEYQKIADPLSYQTRLILLEKRDRWSKVDVEEENDLEGWVYNKYIEKI